jgi:hypothetical protein
MTSGTLLPSTRLLTALEGVRSFLVDNTENLLSDPGFRHWRNNISSIQYAENCSTVNQSLWFRRFNVPILVGDKVKFHRDYADHEIAKEIVLSETIAQIKYFQSIMEKAVGYSASRITKEMAHLAFDLNNRTLDFTLETLNRRSHSPASQKKYEELRETCFANCVALTPNFIIINNKLDDYDNLFGLFDSDIDEYQFRYDVAQIEGVARLITGLTGQEPAAGDSVKAGTWTGEFSAFERAILVKRLVPQAMAALDQIIADFEFKEHNQEADWAAEPLRSLRLLHAELSALIKELERGGTFTHLIERVARSAKKLIKVSESTGQFLIGNAPVFGKTAVSTAVVVGSVEAIYPDPVGAVGAVGAATGLFAAWLSADKHKPPG